MAVTTNHFCGSGIVYGSYIRLTRAFPNHSLRQSSSSLDAIVSNRLLDRDSLIETPPQRINHSVSVRDVAPAMPLQPHSTNTRVHLSNNIASNTANVGGPEKTENSFDKDKKEARLITVDEKRKRRYEALKRDYPDMEDIPQILGKGRRKKLIAEYNAKHGLQAPPPPEPRLPPDPTTLRRSRRLEKIRAAASLEPQPEDEESREGRQTRTARWAALRHEADMGRSRRNPITIE